MGMRWGAGPVFQYELLMASRRWQLYAGRVLLVGGLLAGLAMAWIYHLRYHHVYTFKDLSVIGSAFFNSIMWVELLLTLLAVPAATAGAVCVDKMRGGLLLTLATDLTDFEIVFGKLASRLATVLGVLGCGLPVLAITSWLGGIDPWDAFGGTLVVIGLAVLSVTVTLTFSVWATRPSEALMATYATWTVWLLALPVCEWLSPGGNLVLRWTLLPTHPFALIFGNSNMISQQLAPIFWLRVMSLIVSLGVSLALAMLCVWRIRDVTVRQAGGKAPAAVRRKGFDPWRRLRWPFASIDRNPLLWREWYHSTTTGMARKVWRLYTVLSTLFVATTVFLTPHGEMSAFGGGVMVTIGLLFVSTTAATRLAEERAYGSLDVLLATPLSSHEIFEGKWWGSYREVPALAALAGAIGFGMYLRSHRSIPGAIIFALLLSGLVLAYGAVVTSIGLASAVRLPRLGRAIAVSVTLYLAAAIFYPFTMILMFSAGPDDVVQLWPSPLFGVFMQLERAGGFRSAAEHYSNLVRMAVLIPLTLLVAKFIRQNTVRSFDRLLGRVSEGSRMNPMKAQYIMSAYQKYYDFDSFR